MSNLSMRLLTAFLLIPLLIAAIEWKSPLGVWLWVFLAQVTGLREWMNMMMPGEPWSSRWLGVVMGAAVAACAFWVPRHDALLLCLCAVTVITLLFFLFRHQSMDTVAGRVSAVLSGILYAGLLIAPLSWFKKRPEGDGGAWIYICLTTSWLSDTGAYFAGRFLGPYWPAKLYKEVSPKKTVVGSIGGLLGSVLALVIAKLWYLPVLTWPDVLCIAVPANVLGQAGDLCESLLKRSVDVKDSGVLLPGHGGMLDRIDALLFVVPYVYAYAAWRF